MTLSKSGLELAERIKKAINDEVITTREYEEIINLVNEDGRIDEHERVLMRELKDMVENGLIKRIAA